MRGVFYFKKYYVITFAFIINKNYNSPILLIIIIMLKLLTSRLIQLLLVVWSVGTLTFVLMRSLPGDMAYRIAASRYGYDQVTASSANQVRAELGLDLPWYEQYIAWFGDLLRLDLGNSLVSGASVWDEIAHQFGHTLSLAFVALIISLIIAPPIGILSALRPNGVFDRFTLFIATLLRSAPAFIIGVLLITIFAVHLKWLPAIGYGKPINYVLPALTLALGLSAVSIRVSRNAAVAVLDSTFYEFAKLKGLSPWQAFRRHGVRNIAIPIVAYHGVQLIYLIEGVVIVESLFAWPGIGHALVHAIIARDIPMIQGSALVMGGLFVMLNAILDVINRYIDPRYEAH
ncbi:Glutathione transport system permease protein gsiC [Moraxella lacunata]|uniref:Glutathione transport system permease protein gsiC n=2 Tax=Moraxella lacunata TaxID=477 RepID=A0A378T4I5_MORLA|nr:Glutathione transport system permease protein gsiC [Moraxella lacunata]